MTPSWQEVVYPLLVALLLWSVFMLTARAAVAASEWVTARRR